MDIFRKLGIAITFFVPSFVFSGLVWEWFHSWLAVLAMLVIMGILYSRVITGKILGKPASGEEEYAQ